MTEHLVVVGASVAGLRAIRAARRAGHRGRITLIGSESELPYDRIPLSKAFLSQALSGSAVHPPLMTTEKELVEELGVELQLNQTADWLDTDQRTIGVASRDIAYDALVIATGSAARWPEGPLPPIGVYTFRTLDDARRVAASVRPGGRVILVGAGFIGAELAGTLSRAGAHVTLLDAAVTPLTRVLGNELASICGRLHALNGIDFRPGVVVSEFVGVDGLRRVKLSDGSELDCDVAVVGIGTAPATAWLAGSGLECHDGVVCNENLETTTAGIYAAGDVARWTNPAYGTPMRTEAWAHAAEQGDVAGFNAVTDGPLRAYSTVPYAWSDWYGHRLQFVGVAPRDCEVHMAVDDVANGRILALCHTNGHLTGALTLGYPHLIMKLRRMIGAKESLRSVLDFVITKLVPANPIPSLEV